MRILIFFLVFISALPGEAECGEEVLHIASVENNRNARRVELILSNAYKNIGYRTIFYRLPSKRALLSAAAGDLDGEIGRIDGVGKIYPNLLQVPTPYFSLTAYAYTMNWAHLAITDWADLKEFRIGIKRGVLYAARGTAGMDVSTVETSEELFSMLQHDRVDFVIENQFIAKSILKENSGFDQIKEVGLPLFDQPMYHYLHSSKKHIVPLIDAQFQRQKSRQSGFQN